MLERKAIALLITLAFVVNASSMPVALAATAVTQASLAANPTSVLVGQPTTLTLVTPASYRSSVIHGVSIAFGDGTSGMLLMSFVDASDSFRGFVTHAYGRAGTYQASVTIASTAPGTIAVIPQKFTATVSVTAPQPSPTPMPRPTAKPFPTPTPAPRPTSSPRAGYPIAGMSLSWPDGTTHTTVSPTQQVPQAIARIRFANNSTIVGQWYVDGKPQQTVRVTGRQDRVTEVRYVGPLPRNGSHDVQFRILSPNATGLVPPTPAPPIEYAMAGAAVQTTTPSAPVSSSLAWPDGSHSIRTDGIHPPPAPVALVRTSGAESVTIQWFVDGNASTVAEASAAGPGSVQFTYTQPLPGSGSHRVSIAIVSPASRAPEPIDYGPNETMTPATAPLPTVNWNAAYRYVAPAWPHGVIDLVAPEYAQQADCTDQCTTVYQTPTVTDQTVFTWREENPGVARTFEIRFYDNGGNLVISKKLDDAQTYFQPDAAFLAQLLALRLKGLKQMSASGSKRAAIAPNPNVLKLARGNPQNASSWAGLKKLAGNLGYTQAGAIQLSQLQKMVDAADFSWDVRGYDTIGNVTAEVERSDRWPLKSPGRFLGIGSCDPATGHGSFQQNGAASIQLEDYDDPTSKGSTNTNYYIGDNIGFVSGAKIDLSNSPYGAPVQVDSQQPVGPAPPPNSFDLRTVDYELGLPSVFVDWGDGTVQPLSAQLSVTPTHQSFNPNAPLAAPAVLDTAQMKHQYGAMGDYPIRIYQVAESDLNATSTSALGMQDDASAANSSFAYAGALTGGGRLHFGADTGGANASAALSRAYVVFCATAKVTSNTDNVATGPLHLEKATIDNFGPNTVAAPRTPIALRSVRTVSAVLAIGRSSGGAGGTVYGSDSTCDDGLTANGTLYYYGTGDAQMTWLVDGVSIGTQRLDGLSSPARNDLTRHEQTAILPPGSPPQRRSFGPTLVPAIEATQPLAPTTFLSSKTLGSHTVHVAVAVAPPEPGAPNLGTISLRDPSALAGLHVGVLSPLTTSSPQLPPVAYPRAGAPSHAIAAAHTIVANAGNRFALPAPAPGTFVVSNDGIYTIAAGDPKAPCKFEFATTSGTFEISGLQHNVKKSGSTFTGVGKLLLAFRTDAVTTVQRAVMIPIDGWSVPDGINVRSGTIDAGTSGSAFASVNRMPFAGTSASLTHVHAVANGGSPSGPMNATFTFTLEDNILQAPSGGSPHFAPQTAALNVDGDWKSAPVRLPTTRIGNSGFEIAANGAVFDYVQGDVSTAPAGCSTNGGFLGLRLNAATITINSLNLVGSGSNQLTVNDWVVGSNGLCGHVAANPNFVAQYGHGEIDIPSVKIDVVNSVLNAEYDNMRVHEAWLDADMTGNATIDGTGNAKFGFTAQPVVKDLGPVKMTVDNLEFGNEQGHGFAIFGDGHFDFYNGSTKLVHADAPNMVFPLATTLHFANGSPVADISVGGSAMFNQTAVDLKNVHVALSADPNGEYAFGIAVGVRISEALPESPTTIHYTVVDPPGSLHANEPTMDQFKTEAATPLAKPSQDAEIHPRYGKAPDGSDRYSGEVNLANFGGPPISATFLLGYQSSTDYWAVYGSFSPSVGIVVGPGISLYEFGGGMGYHVRIDRPSDLQQAQFAPNVDVTVLADVQVGSPDQAYTYWLHGTLKVQTGDPLVRLDYEATVLDNDHSVANTHGAGAFDGYFQWTPGNFDGALEGQVQPPGLSGAIRARIPGPNYGGGPYAGSFHFGGGEWHVDLGTQANPVTAYVLVISVDAWFDLGNTGLDVGASASFNFQVGGSFLGVYVNGNVTIVLVVTPQPHVRGDASANLNAGGSILGISFSVGVGASIHGEAMPIALGGTAYLHIGMPWPIPDVNANVGFSA